MSEESEMRQEKKRSYLAYKRTMNFEELLPGISSFASVSSITELLFMQKNTWVTLPISEWQSAFLHKFKCKNFFVL
jgi:hypothetical protein